MLSTGKSNKIRQKKIEKVIFIDRDGVINEDLIGDYIKTWKQFRFVPAALDAMQKLSKSGYAIVIISNQAGIGDGAYKKSALDEITKKMLARMRRSKVNIRGIYYCLHGKNDGCSCRKPEVGLFKRAAEKIGFVKKQTFFIGDKLSDVIAGKRFGLKTAFVLTGHGRYDVQKLNGAAKPDLIGTDLMEVANFLMAEKIE